MKNLFKLAALLFVIAITSSALKASCDCKWLAKNSFVYEGQHPEGMCSRVDNTSGFSTGGMIPEWTCTNPRIKQTKGWTGTLFCRGYNLEAKNETGADGCEACKGLDYGECHVQFMDGSYSVKWPSGKATVIGMGWISN